MSRVLLDHFGTIAAMGLREALDEQGFELVDCAPLEANDEGAADLPGDVLQKLVAVAPDVVVLNLDVAQGERTAEEISRRFPAIKVIACSAGEPFMRVYPPFHHGDYYVSDLSISLLAEAVRSRT